MYEVLSKKHETMVKRVEDLEFTSHRTQKRQTVFEDIFRRISELVKKFLYKGISKGIFF